MNEGIFVTTSKTTKKFCIKKSRNAARKNGLDLPPNQKIHYKIAPSDWNTRPPPFAFPIAELFKACDSILLSCMFPLQIELRSSPYPDPKVKLLFPNLLGYETFFMSTKAALTETDRNESTCSRQDLKQHLTAQRSLLLFARRRPYIPCILATPSSSHPLTKNFILTPQKD